jgi:transposase
MTTTDARSLSGTAQEDLRRRAVKAMRDGMSQTEAARVFDVARGTLNRWMGLYRRQGSHSLKARRRGRPPVSRLEPLQAATLVRLIEGRCPDQLNLPFALWTRGAVKVLMERRFGVRVSVWTVGRYLAGWGFTPQKPLRRAFERDPEQIRRWLEEKYPAIQRTAKQAGAAIYWGDEMGLRSDHQAGRTYGRRGRTPVIPGTGQRFRCNMISAITNRGKIAWMVFRENFTVKVYLKFLRRLVRHAKRLVFLIEDQHPVHRSREGTRWLHRHRKQIRRFFLPGYSPELNPDELLNQDVKTNALGRQRPEDLEEMLDDIRSYLWSTQRQPHIVRAYFREPHVQYAAA